MTEATTGTAASGNKGVKKGLPLTGLPEASQSAESLWEVARLGLAPKMAFAEKLGRSAASGGGWDRLIAVLRGFDLIKLDADQIGLSALGQELVNGSDKAQQLGARRTSLLHLKAYRELVESFDGTTLPDNTDLASRLKFEFGKSDEFAEKAAQAFRDSLTFAEMIDGHGRVRKNGADAAVDPDPVDEDDEEQVGLIDNAFEADDDSETDAKLPDGADMHDESSDLRFASFRRGEGSAQVNISVSLDLSKYRADEVVQILKVLNG